MFTISDMKTAPLIGSVVPLQVTYSRLSKYKKILPKFLQLIKINIYWTVCMVCISVGTAQDQTAAQHFNIYQWYTQIRF